MPGLTIDQRLAVNRIRALQGSIEVGFAMAHAFRDLGRDAEARMWATAELDPAAELTRLVRTFTAELAQGARRAEQGLGALTARWEAYLYLGLVVAAVATALAGYWTLQAVEGPLGRILVAAERFGDADLRPVTTGRMPHEVQVLADAMRRMGDRLRGIVSDVIGESDRIAGSAGDLSAISEQLAASASEGGDVHRR